MSKKRVKEVSSLTGFTKPKDVPFTDYVRGLDNPELISFMRLIEFSQVSEDKINHDFANLLEKEGVVYHDKENMVFKLTEKAKMDQFWQKDLVWDVAELVSIRNEQEVRKTMATEPKWG